MDTLPGPLGLTARRLEAFGVSIKVGVPEDQVIAGVRKVAGEMDQAVASKDSQSGETVVTDELERLISSPGYMLECVLKRMQALLQCIEGDTAADEAVREKSDVTFGEWILSTAGDHPLEALSISRGSAAQFSAADEQVRARMGISREAWARHNP